MHIRKIWSDLTYLSQFRSMRFGTETAWCLAASRSLSAISWVF